MTNTFFTFRQVHSSLKHAHVIESVAHPMSRVVGRLIE